MTERRLKIYVAARFGEKDKVRQIYERLEKLGYEISSKWTEHEENWTLSERGQNIYGSNPEYARSLSIKDLKGVIDCDVFMLLHTQEGGQGKFIEYGAALASGKYCVIVNPTYVDDCMFFYCPKVYLHFDLDSAISMISELKETL